MCCPPGSSAAAEGVPADPAQGCPSRPPNPKATAPSAQEKGMEESHCPQHHARFPPAVLSPGSRPKHRPAPLHPGKHRAPPPGFGTAGSAQPRLPSRTALAHPSPTFCLLCLPPASPHRPHHAGGRYACPRGAACGHATGPRGCPRHRGATTTLTWVSERLSCRASSVLSLPTTYWQRWNSSSRR